MKHEYQSFTRIGRRFQSLKRQVYAVWTSVSFPLCQRSCLIWRILTNPMTNTYVVIFLLASFFGQSYHSRYQNFEFTGAASELYVPARRHDVTPKVICRILSIFAYFSEVKNATTMNWTN